MLKTDLGFGLRVVCAKDIYNTGDSRRRFDLLCRDGLLGIDDLGTEPKEEMSYGSVTTPVSDLLECRYNRQLFTVISTNLTPSQIKRYGLRIASRCREMFLNIVFRGEKATDERISTHRLYRHAGRGHAWRWRQAWLTVPDTAGRW